MNCLRLSCYCGTLSGVICGTMCPPPRCLQQTAPSLYPGVTLPNPALLLSIRTRCGSYWGRTWPNLDPCTDCCSLIRASTRNEWWTENTWDPVHRNFVLGKSILFCSKFLQWRKTRWRVMPGQKFRLYFLTSHARRVFFVLNFKIFYQKIFFLKFGVQIFWEQVPVLNQTSSLSCFQIGGTWILGGTWTLGGTGTTEKFTQILFTKKLECFWNVINV